MVLRRIAEAIDRRPNTGRVRRSILQLAADDFVKQLPQRKGRSGNWGVSGWDVSNLAHPAFWSMALLSQRRQRYAMTLIGQVYVDQAAVQPYVQEKRSTEQVLHSLDGIDADSLVGFVDAAVMLFQPPNASGAPLVPTDQATEILRLALLRGAMVGELRPDEIRPAWSAAHPDQVEQHGPEVAWKKAQGRAEMLLEGWSQSRRSQGRRII
ncbi:MAG: hypothetical protein OXH13_08670 [Chloroflexi bacterium]|nr:hypothetical protein [Chloroflexota bacterium]MCY3697543.1 hypothetical protein [Chloroflexota bacterium]MXX32246.1 hypothetical protein [Chloroflexota bacterium]MXX79777.1 hypothetical protein [Chloroflexota bacterium]MYB21734.1 hypothetical protein [Chloroflexota bacterium]